ncbi:MAG: MBL fold metallo-hydrolase [Bacteroidota bacterium]|nr:MBL fold metallo-hydrolase [Bacteroidota bacterium]
MKLRFLGTGTSQGVPVIGCKCEVCTSIDPRDHRLRSSVLLQHNDKNIVIDAGPDFRQQMLEADISSLDAILLTHEHKDHIGGLDDVRAFNYLQKKPTDIYGEKRVLDALKNYDFAYVFAKKEYPGVPKFELHTISNSPFSVGDIEIIPIRGIHKKLPVFGFRINSFAYITDMNMISDKEMKKLENLDVLVINALRRRTHPSHFNLESALKVIQQLKPKEAYLTHMSHYIGTYKDLFNELPKNIMPAYDRLEIDIN